MRRLCLAVCLVLALPAPAEAQRRPADRHHAPRITRDRPSWYEREIRFRQTERRITEARRLRERQRDAARSARHRDRDFEDEGDEDTFD